MGFYSGILYQINSYLLNDGLFLGVADGAITKISIHKIKKTTNNECPHHDTIANQHNYTKKHSNNAKLLAEDSRMNCFRLLVLAGCSGSV